MYNKNGELIFDLVRKNIVKIDGLSKQLDQVVRQKDFQQLYSTFVDPILPDEYKCKDECYLSLKNYNRHDLFEKQLSKINYCKGIDGNEYHNCLDIFEETSREFYEYFQRPYQVQTDVLSDYQDGTLITDSVWSYMEFNYMLMTKYFMYGLGEYFDRELSDKKLQNICLILNITCTTICCACVVFQIIWLFYRKIWISIISPVNAFMIVILSLSVGYLLGYSAFLEQSTINLDKMFKEKNVEPYHKSVFDGIECKTGYFGTSLQLWKFTTGREFTFNDNVMTLYYNIIPEIIDRINSITRKIVFFAILDPQSSETLYPFYKISDSEFNELTKRNIVNNPLFYMLSPLYDDDNDKMEENIISYHISVNTNFSKSYNNLFSKGKECEGYSLADIDTCVKDMKNENYIYLRSLPVTKGLAHIEEIKNSLEDFTRNGEIYKIEKEMINTMTLIVRHILYKASNDLASSYGELSKQIIPYSEFIYSDKFYVKLVSSLQRLVNFSCTNTADVLNNFRELTICSIPNEAFNIHFSLWLVFFIPLLNTFLNAAYKKVAGIESSTICLRKKKRISKQEKDFLSEMNDAEKEDINSNYVIKENDKDRNISYINGNVNNKNKRNEDQEGNKTKINKTIDDSSDEETFGNIESFQYPTNSDVSLKSNSGSSQLPSMINSSSAIYKFPQNTANNEDGNVGKNDDQGDKTSPNPSIKEYYVNYAPIIPSRLKHFDQTNESSDTEDH